MPPAQGHFAPFGLTIRSRQISNMVPWKRFKLKLKSKCKVMTLRRVNPIRATYTLSECPMDRIARVDDLGVLLDPKLKFSDHISTIVNKARGVLGFIERWSKEIDDPYMTKTLFISLVQCVWCLESTIRSPLGPHWIGPKNILLFALWRLNWEPNHILPPYSSRQLLINLPSLANCKTMLGIEWNGMEFVSLLVVKLRVPTWLVVLISLFNLKSL